MDNAWSFAGSFVTGFTSGAITRHTSNFVCHKIRYRNDTLLRGPIGATFELTAGMAYIVALQLSLPRTGSVTGFDTGVACTMIVPNAVLFTGECILSAYHRQMPALRQIARNVGPSMLCHTLLVSPFILWQHKRSKSL